MDAKLLIVIAVVALCFFVFPRKKKSNLSMEFKLPAECQLLATDLGGQQLGKPLIGLGLIGFADAIFRHDSSIYVCEYKNRSYRNCVRLYEYYQVILYAGLAKKRYQANVSCRIKYKNTVVSFDFDEAVFKGLLAMRSELSHSSKSLFGGILSSPQPLHKRMAVRINPTVC